MKTVIISQYAFPYGQAVTNRLISYAQGLVENGMPVDIFCIKATENRAKIINKLCKGEFKGISFKYTTGTTIKVNNLLSRIYLNYYGFLNALFRLIKLNSQSKVKAVILVGPLSFLKELLLFLCCKILSIKLLQERSEYPFLTNKPSFFFKINLCIYLHLSCKFYDGMIIITNALKDYFSKYIRKSSELFLMPIIVDSDRFKEIRDENLQNEKYIAYCGSMEGNKDGVPILIEAFHIISGKYPEFKLFLIGDTNFADFKMLKNSIEEKGITNKVIFTGRIERDEMPLYLSNASILALSRPNSKQAEGGFPTKLGEYLSTAKPVVVTKVGEIPQFLIHHKNAYLAEPGNARDFALKLDEVLSDYKKALSIGKEGQKLAHTVFNYQFQGERLAAFIKSL